MIDITDEIREEVLNYLECEADVFDNKFYAFYYRCMQAGMDFADADRYAILNTLFNYDVGMENSRAIDTWMYEHDKEIYELTNNKKDKALLAVAVAELGLNIDFSGWIEENYTEYKFFED